MVDGGVERRRRRRPIPRLDKEKPEQNPPFPHARSPHGNFRSLPRLVVHSEFSEALKAPKMILGAKGAKENC